MRWSTLLSALMVASQNAKKCVCILYDRVLASRFLLYIIIRIIIYSKKFKANSVSLVHPALTPSCYLVSEENQGALDIVPVRVNRLDFLLTIPELPRHTGDCVNMSIAVEYFDSGGNFGRMHPGPKRYSKPQKFVMWGYRSPKITRTLSSEVGANLVKSCANQEPHFTHVYRQADSRTAEGISGTGKRRLTSAV